MAEAVSASRARLSLRAILYGTVGTLSLLLCLVLGRECVTAWQKAGAAREAVAVADAARDAFAAVQVARLERGPIRDGLLGPKPVAAADIDRLVHIHDRLDAPLNALIKACAAVDCAAGPHGADLAAARDATDAARRAAVPLLPKPLPERTPNAGAAWYDAASPLVDALEKTSAALTEKLRAESGFAARLAQVKDAAYVARDSAGRQRTPLVGAIQTGRMSAAQELEYRSLGSGVAAAWAVVKAVADDQGTPPAVAAAVAKANAAYFTELGKSAEAVIHALAAGQPAPMTATAMSATVDQAANALMAVADAALAAIADHARDEAAGARDATVIDLGILLIGLVAAFGGCLAMRLGVLRPLGELVAALRRLAARDYGFTLASARAREVQQMIDAVATCREGLQKADALAEAQAAEQAVKAERVERLGAALRRFEDESATALAGMAEAARALDGTATEMETAATEGARLAGAVSERTGVAASGTQAAAAGAEELSSSIGEISRQVGQATEIARNAVAETERTDGSIRALNEAASRIGDAVKLIADIAGQTNLLALNATIEAARAGDAGKGFAVVASEVKALATQTARATEEIGAQVAGVRQASEAAAGAIRSIGSVVSEVDQVAAAIAAAVEQQGAATREIARNVAGAAGAVEMVSGETENLRAGSARADQAAGQVRSTSDAVTLQAESLRGRIERFLTEARAA